MFSTGLPVMTVLAFTEPVKCDSGGELKSKASIKNLFIAVAKAQI